MNAKQLIEVPLKVWVGLVRESWFAPDGISLVDLLEGGRERFIQAVYGATSESSQWPEALRRPTLNEIGDVYDALIREGVS